MSQPSPRDISSYVRSAAKNLSSRNPAGRISMIRSSAEVFPRNSFSSTVARTSTLLPISAKHFANGIAKLIAFRTAPPVRSSIEVNFPSLSARFDCTVQFLSRNTGLRWPSPQGSSFISSVTCSTVRQSPVISMSALTEYSGILG